MIKGLSKQKEEHEDIYSDPNGLKVGGQKFEVIKHDWLDSKEYRLTHRSAESILNYLKRTAVRFKTSYDLGLHDRFYKYGFIVSSKSLRDLAHAFGYSGLTQIRKFVNSLIKNGEIYISEVNVGKIRPQHVYVLGIHNGRHNNNFEELFFTELRFSSKLDKNINKYLDEFGVNKKIINWDLQVPNK